VGLKGLDAKTTDWRQTANRKVTLTLTLTLNINYKRFKLGGVQAYDRSSDFAAVVA
jgi:hypothetical protein